MSTQRYSVTPPRNYGEFLEERRRLMALKTKAWFEVL
jgi:hypothetical protein